MRNRLLQVVCLLAFAVTALPGQVALHWALGLEHHHHAQQSTKSSAASRVVHKHAHCKHHHHQSSSDSTPTDDSFPTEHGCSICDFYSQPMSDALAPFELSISLASDTTPLAVEVVRAFDPLAIPPARGPPSLM